MESRHYDILVFRCSKCKYTTMECNRAMDHVKIKRCRGSDIWKEIGKTTVSDRVIIHPPEFPTEIAEEIVEEKPQKLKTELAGRLGSGELAERIEHMQNPRVAKAIFQGESIDVAVSMFRYLWGPEAPQELRSIVKKRDAIYSIRSTDPLELVTHRGMSDVKNLLVSLSATFDRLAESVTNRLYVKRAQDLQEFLGGELSVADILSRNEHYAKYRRKPDMIPKIKLVQRLKKEILGALERL